MRKLAELGWTKLQKIFLQQHFPSCQMISDSIKDRYAQAGGIGLDKAAKKFLRLQFPSYRIIGDSTEGRYAQAGGIGLNKAAKTISPTTVSILLNYQRLNRK